MTGRMSAPPPAVAAEQSLPCQRPLRPERLWVVLGKGGGGLSLADRSSKEVVKLAWKLTAVGPRCGTTNEDARVGTSRAASPSSLGRKQEPLYQRSGVIDEQTGRTRAPPKGSDRESRASRPCSNLQLSAVRRTQRPSEPGGPGRRTPC